MGSNKPTVGHAGKEQLPLDNRIYEELSEHEEGKKKALIITISDYSNNLQHLEFCRRDGAEMYEVLTSLGYHIPSSHVLIGNVKYESMRDAIIDFFRDPTTKAED